MKKESFADIEYSKKLAWLWPLNSKKSPYFWWIEYDRKKGVGKFNIYSKGTSPWPWSGHHYPAITTDMCLEVLPYTYSKKKTRYYHDYFLTIYKLALGYVVKYERKDNSWSHLIAEKKLSNALCKMILWLVEEKIIK